MISMKTMPENHILNKSPTDEKNTTEYKIMPYKDFKTDIGFLAVAGSCVVIAMSLIILGPCNNSQKTIDKIEQQKMQEADALLPTNSKVKEYLGNNWFLIEIDGTSYLFTFHTDINANLHRTITKKN